MLLARDLDHGEAVVDREQRKEAREVAVERNVLEYVAPRCAHPARAVVQRAVREPARSEMQGEMLKPIYSRVEAGPPPRHGEIDAAIHRREELANRGGLNLPVSRYGDDDAPACLREAHAQQRRLTDAARRLDRAHWRAVLRERAQRFERLMEERMRDEDELVAPGA